MEQLPPELEELRLTGFTISPSERDVTGAGVVLHRADGGTFHVIMTRQQLLDFIEESRKALEVMQKPS